jgi:transposase
MQTEAFRRTSESNQPRLGSPPPSNPRLASNQGLAHGLSSEQLQTLTEWAESDDARRRGRARIILLSAQGMSPEEVSKRLAVAVPTVYKWLRRFSRHGVAGLSDLPRSGQPHRLPKETRAEILRVTREEPPPQGARWTIRVAARHLGVTQHQIRQVWSDAGMRPHRADPSDVQA